MNKFLLLFLLLFSLPTIAQVTGQTRYPAELDTAQTLLEARNNTQSSLNGAITSSATTLILADATNFPSSGIVSIQSEIVYYSDKSGNTLSGLLRGKEGTIAASHANGLLVRINITQAYHNNLRDSVIALQGKIGKGSATPGSPFQ